MLVGLFSGWLVKILQLRNVVFIFFSSERVGVTQHLGWQVNPYSYPHEFTERWV